MEETDVVHEPFLIGWDEGVGEAFRCVALQQRWGGREGVVGECVRSGTFSIAAGALLLLIWRGVLAQSAAAAAAISRCNRHCVHIDFERGRVHALLFGQAFRKPGLPDHLDGRRKRAFHPQTLQNRCRRCVFILVVTQHVSDACRELLAGAGRGGFLKERRNLRPRFDDLAAIFFQGCGGGLGEGAAQTKEVGVDPLEEERGGRRLGGRRGHGLCSVKRGGGAEAG